jgi:SRSO17 transposase
MSHSTKVEWRAKTIRYEKNDTHEDIKRWGLSLEAIEQLGGRLYEFWERFSDRFRTRTRDTSLYAFHYVSGVLRMESQRNLANVGRKTQTSGQNMQHFMSNSPWSGASVIRQVQEEVIARPELQGGMLLLDESAAEKAGTASAGAGRQYNGRQGKVTESQVGVFVAYVKDQTWTWIDGDLFVPESWFSAAYAEKRAAVGMPPARQFATKVDLGWQLIQRAKANGVPFVAVGCDELYGRSYAFRDQLHAADIEYYADVPQDTYVCLNEPQIGEVHPKGKQTQRHLLTPKYRVRDLVHHPALTWSEITVRPIERGMQCIPFAARRVWTVRPDQRYRQEWLLIHRQANGKYVYALSNAPAATPLETLAARKMQRALIECANRDAKSDLGWDEFQARKWLAWEHNLALTILASWFIAETRLDWERDATRDPALLAQFEVEVLPTLSYANVRELLRAAMPLPQLTPADAARLVIEHLTNRTRSRRARLRQARSTPSRSP